MTKPANPICGRPGCKYVVPHEHVKFGAAKPPHKVYDIEDETEDADVDKIAAAVRALPCSDDPEADRFKNMAPEEARQKVLLERLTKVGSAVDTLHGTLEQVRQMGVSTSQIGQQITNRLEQPPGWANMMTAALDALVNLKDHVPKWASIMTTNFERLYSTCELSRQDIISNIHNLGSIGCDVRTVNKKLDELPKPIKFWDVVLAVLVAEIILIGVPLGVATGYFFFNQWAGG